MPEERTTQFVLLPVRGLRARGRAASEEASNFLRSLHDSSNGNRLVTLSRGARPSANTSVRVLDSIAEDGAKLIELSQSAALALREARPDLRIVPMRLFRTQRFRPVVHRRTGTTASGASIRLMIVAAITKQPIAHAEVIAFTDYDARVGVNARTNAKGVVELRLGKSTTTLDRLYVYPERDFWGLRRLRLKVSSGDTLQLRPLDVAAPDVVSHFYDTATPSTGKGISVGVIDTGVGPHPDLSVFGGFNSVLHEKTNDFGDNGDGHGTHVAGIIAARGVAPRGRRGLAPGARLSSYRVFAKGSDTATNFAIAKAIDRAVQDGCDLINMSLGGGDPDEAVQAAIEDAFAQGSLVFAAAGNEDRSPVAFPASASPPAIAVSALGRKGTFPAGSIHADAVMRPYGRDRNNFLAAFSNIGPEIDLVAPGVAVISTVPGGYVAMDGTSMATPAAVGAAARLLSGQPQLLAMPRAAARAAALLQFLFGRTQKVGFEPIHEGHGILTAP